MSGTTDRAPGGGDVMVVVGRRVGDPGRSGEILEVLGSPGHEHYLVRWEDGRESIFYPSSDARIHRAGVKPGA